MNGRQQGEPRRADEKKPYRPPQLVVHGDIRALTRSKKGFNSDGSRKPRTRRTGAKA